MREYVDRYFDKWFESSSLTCSARWNNSYGDIYIYHLIFNKLFVSNISMSIFIFTERCEITQPREEKYRKTVNVECKSTNQSYCLKMKRGFPMFMAFLCCVKKIFWKQCYMFFIFSQNSNQCIMDDVIIFFKWPLFNFKYKCFHYL